MFEWSHEEQIATVNSNQFISFDIWVEQTTTIGLGEPVVTRLTDLQFEYVDEDEFPETITITYNNDSILIEGVIDASAIFIEKAYSVNGKSISVDDLDEIPFGARVHNLRPENTQYKYYKWKIFVEDELNIVVERIFTLTVIVSWDAARNTIIKLVGEISE